MNKIIFTLLFLSCGFFCHKLMVNGQDSVSMCVDEEKKMSEIIMVYITVPSEGKAKEIARALLEKHLIACATMLPCKSMYWWDGVIQDDQELIMFVKTTENKFELLKQELEMIHPYKVPCILKIVAAANVPYAKWVQAEMNACC